MARTVLAKTLHRNVSNVSSPSVDLLSTALPGGSIGPEIATDVLVVLDDRPGELARLGEAAGAGGVNIQGLAAFTGDGKGSRRPRLHHLRWRSAGDRH